MEKFEWFFNNYDFFFKPIDDPPKSNIFLLSPY